MEINCQKSIQNRRITDLIDTTCVDDISTLYVHPSCLHTYKGLTVSPIALLTGFDIFLKPKPDGI